MLKIGICDDSIESIARLEKLIKTYCLKKGIDYKAAIFTSADTLLQYNLYDIDILFLDVEMGDYNGIEVAEEIRKRNQELLLVYVSAYIEFAPAGYNVKAFAYILKNDLDKSFEITMDDIISNIGFRNELYSFKCDDYIVSIPLQNISYIESFDKNIEIHTKDWKKEIYTTKAQLNEVILELHPKGFLQIHRSYIVNMQHIKKIKNYSITMSNDKTLPVSQRRWKEILSRYMYWKGKM